MPLKDLLVTCQSSKSRVNFSLCCSLSCSCPVVGTSQWDLWWLWSKSCLQSHSWSWTSGSIWMEPRLRVRCCSGLNSRWELALIYMCSRATAVRHMFLFCICFQQILDSRMVDMISDGTLPCADGNGQVKLSLSYTPQDRQLVVIVHACRCVTTDTLSWPSSEF